MRFDCIPPEFSPFRNFKKNIGKLNSLTVRKKKIKKNRLLYLDVTFDLRIDPICTFFLVYTKFGTLYKFMQRLHSVKIDCDIESSLYTSQSSHSFIPYLCNCTIQISSV